MKNLAKILKCYKGTNVEAPTAYGVFCGRKNYAVECGGGGYGGGGGDYIPIECYDGSFVRR